MTRYRVSILAFVAAIAVTFNLERLDLVAQNDLNLSPVAYGIAIALVASVAFRRLARFGPVTTVASWLGLYVGCHLLLLDRPLLGGPRTLFAVAEMSLLAVAALGARRLASVAAEFDDSVCTLTLGRTDSSIRSVEATAAEVDRTLLACHRHGRPLTVLAVEPDPGPELVASHSAVEELQAGMHERFRSNALADAARASIRRTDITAREAVDGRLVIVCPDTDEEQARSVVAHVGANLAARLGCQAHFGLATFPEAGLTLEHLLERAEVSLAEDCPSTAPPPDAERGQGSTGVRGRLWPAQEAR